MNLGVQNNENMNLLQKSLNDAKDSINRKSILESKHSRQLRLEKVIASIRLILDAVTSDASIRYLMFDQENIELLVQIMDPKRGFEYSIVQKIFEIIHVISDDITALTKGGEIFVTPQLSNHCYWGHSFYQIINYYIDNEKTTVDGLATLFYMIYNIDSSLLFRNEGGLYLVSNLYHNSHDNDICNLCQGIVKRILEICAEDFIRCISINEILLLCLYDDSYIASTALYWMSVYAENSCSPLYDMIILNPSVMYTTVYLNYFNKQLLKNSSIVFNDETLQLCIYTVDSEFFAKVNLAYADIKIVESIDEDKNALYIIKLYIPRIINELSLTFYDKTIFNYWNELLHKYLIEKDNTRPYMDFPDSPFVNVPISEFIMPTSESDFQVINYLISTRLQSPLDNISLIKYLSSLLYNDQFVEYMYMYSLDEYIIDMLNTTIESLTACLHDTQCSVYYSSLTPQDAYDILITSCVYYLYQLTSYSEYICNFINNRDILIPLFRLLNESPYSPCIISCLNILLQSIVNSSEDYCVYLLKYLPSVFKINEDYIQPAYKEIYYTLILGILNEYLRAGHRGANEITKNDGFMFIYNIYFKCPLPAVKENALNLLENIYGFANASTLCLLSIQQLAILLQLKKERIVYQIIRYLYMMLTTLLTDAKSKPIETLEHYNDYLYLGQNLHLFKALVLDILQLQFHNVDNYEINQYLLVHICLILQLLSTNETFVTEMWNNKTLFLLLSCLSTNSAYAYEPDNDCFYCIVITVATCIHRYSGDINSFWSHSPNLDTSIYTTLSVPKLSPDLLGAMCLLLAALNKSPFIKELFIQHQQYYCLENVFLTGKEQAVEGAAILLGTIASHKNVADWITSLEERGKSHIFTKYLTNFTQYSVRTIVAVLYCIEELAHFQSIKQIIYNNNDTILLTLVNFSNGITTLTETESMNLPSLLINRLQTHLYNSVKTVCPLISFRSISALETLVETSTKDHSLLVDISDQEPLFTLLKCTSSTLVQGLTLITLSSRIRNGCLPLRLCVNSAYFIGRCEIQSHKFGGGILKVLFVVEADRIILYRSTSVLPYKCFYFHGTHSCSISTQLDGSILLKFGDYLLSTKMKEDLSTKFIAILNALLAHSLPPAYALIEPNINLLTEANTKDVNYLQSKYSKSDVLKLYNIQHSLSSSQVGEDSFNLLIYGLDTHDILISLFASRCIASLLLTGGITNNDSYYTTLLTTYSNFLSKPLLPTAIEMYVLNIIFMECKCTEWICPCCYYVSKLQHNICNECGYLYINCNEHIPIPSQQETPVSSYSVPPTANQKRISTHLSNSKIDMNGVSPNTSLNGPSQTSQLWSFVNQRSALYSYISTGLYVLSSSEVLCHSITKNHVDLLFKTLYTSTPYYTYYVLQALNNIAQNSTSSVVLMDYISRTIEPFYALQTIMENTEYTIINQHYIYSALMNLLIALSKIDTCECIKQLSEFGCFTFLTDLYASETDDIQALAKTTLISLYSNDYTRLLTIPIKLLLDTSLLSIEEIKEVALKAILNQPNIDQNHELMYLLFHSFVPIAMDQLVKYTQIYGIYHKQDEDRLILYIRILNTIIKNQLVENELLPNTLLPLCIQLFTNSLYHYRIRMFILETLSCILYRNTNLIISLGAYMKFSGFSYIISSARQLDETITLTESEQVIFKLHFAHYCCVIANTPAGIDALFTANILHDIYTNLSSKDERLINVSLQLLYSLLHQNGYGMKSLIGTQYDIKVILSFLIDIYKIYNKNYDIMIYYFDFLRYYCYNNINIQTVLQFLESNNLLESIIRLAIEPDTSIDATNKDKVLINKFRNSITKFVKHLTLYKPYQSDYCIDLSISNQSLFIFAQSSITEVANWAMNLILYRCSLGFTPALSFFQVHKPEFSDYGNYRDKEHIFRKGSIIYDQGCLYIYKAEAVSKFTQLNLKYYVQRFTSLITQDGETYNLVLRSPEGEEIIYIRGNSNLMTLYNLMTRDLAVFQTPLMSSLHLPLHTNKSILRNSNIIKRTVDILTPYSLSYIRLSELLPEEIKCFESFVQNGSEQNNLFLSIYSVLKNSNDTTTSLYRIFSQEYNLFFEIPFIEKYFTLEFVQSYTLMYPCIPLYPHCPSRNPLTFKNASILERKLVSSSKLSTTSGSISNSQKNLSNSNKSISETSSMTSNTN